MYVLSLYLCCLCRDKNLLNLSYDKCPKNLYTKVSNKKAYTKHANTDQTAPEVVVGSWSALFAILLNIFMKQLYKREIYAKEVWNKARNFRTFTEVLIFYCENW